jgi:hypothetical protein
VNVYEDSEGTADSDDASSLSSAATPVNSPLSSSQTGDKPYSLFKKFNQSPLNRESVVSKEILTELFMTHLRNDEKKFEEEHKDIDERRSFDHEEESDNSEKVEDDQEVVLQAAADYRSHIAMRGVATTPLNSHPLDMKEKHLREQLKEDDDEAVTEEVIENCSNEKISKEKELEVSESEERLREEKEEEEKVKQNVNMTSDSQKQMNEIGIEKKKKKKKKKNKKQQISQVKEDKEEINIIDIDAEDNELVSTELNEKEEVVRVKEKAGSIVLKSFHHLQEENDFLMLNLESSESVDQYFALHQDKEEEEGEGWISSNKRTNRKNKRNRKSEKVIQDEKPPTTSSSSSSMGFNDDDDVKSNVEIDIKEEEASPVPRVISQFELEMESFFSERYDQVVKLTHQTGMDAFPGGKQVPVEVIGQGVEGFS